MDGARTCAIIPSLETGKTAMRDNRTCTNAKDYLAQLAALVEQLDGAAIDSFADRLFQAWQADSLVLTFGNGGSASTASHFVTDFVKTAAVEGQRRLRAISLNDNVPMLTAIGNDYDYRESFEHPLDTYGKQSDVAVAVTGSGTSPNIVAACERAKQKGLELICLTGFDGGSIGGMADLHINVPSENYGPIEDLHMSIGHMVTQTLQARVAAQADATRASHA